MGESTKSVCAVLMCVGIVVSAITWVAEWPNEVIWSVRIGGIVLALVSLGLILKLQFRRDLAVDYLRQIAGNYHNRDGFCFTLSAESDEGVAYLDAYFQNQRDKPCIGRIAARPARGFWMGRADFGVITFEIECEPGAFGVARIPIPVPEKMQGKKLAFEVGASVEYKDGKGKLLRYFDGLFLRTNSNFGKGFTTALTVAGAAGGTIVLSRPATSTVQLPTGVSEERTNEIAPEIKTLWKLGDPDL